MKAPSPELIELCGAVRDEVATPEQVARLETLLADDPAARRFYRRFTQISATLERYESLPGAIPEPTLSSPMKRPAWRFGRASQWLALAACFAVIAALYFNLRPTLSDGASGPAAMASADMPVAFIQEARACMLIPRVGPPREFNGAFNLRAGDIVATAAKGSAIIRFAGESTVFILSADTRAWLSREEGAKMVHLTSGHIYGHVAKQEAGSQWRILTADGETKVLGTRLAVSANVEGTRVAVTSGRVRVTARDSRQTVETPAGFAAQLTPTTARLVKLAPSEPTRITSFTVVNADNNAAIPGFESLTDGAVLDLATSPTRRINIRANCAPQLVGLVRFTLTGIDASGNPLNLVVPVAHSFPNQIEIYFPYMLAGDPSFEGELLPNHSFPWTPPIGRYTLTATPYATKQGSGARGEPLTVRFEVVDSGAAK